MSDDDSFGPRIVAVDPDDHAFGPKVHPAIPPSDDVAFGPTVHKPLRRVRGYDPDLAAVICERVGNGEKLQVICAERLMPSAATVFRWLADNPDSFRVAWEAALAAKFDMRADELEAIAADGSNDKELVDGADGAPTLRDNKESLGRSRLRCEMLQWRLGKELPQKFGEPQSADVAPPPLAIEQPKKPVTLAEALREYDRERALVKT